MMKKITCKHALHACVLALALIAHPAHACLNDRDTLAEEAQKHPDILQAITGRFERNPPLYYEMRIARVAKDLQTHPNNLDEYDDIAVACDRLGRDDEAVTWLSRKRAHLPPLAGAAPTLKEAWYKYFANIGTCRIHRWIRGGGDRKKIVEVYKAREEITHAIQIKPDAHFGREKYQGIVMDWLIDSLGPRKKGGEIKPLYLYVEGKVNTARYPEAATAFAGLITLGNAWESVDIFSALAYVSSMGDRSPMHVGYFAALRAVELSRSGHRSLVREVDPTFEPPNYWPRDERAFDGLRREADRWNQARISYMNARLTVGRHPDTDPVFWADYHPAPPPAVPDTTPPEDKRRKLLAEIAPTIFSVAFLAIFGTPIALIVRAVLVRRKRRQKC